jgi:hypothetical protein
VRVSRGSLPHAAAVRTTPLAVLAVDRHSRAWSCRPTLALVILGMVKGGYSTAAPAALAGVVLGVTAQVMRQVNGSLMALGASIAPWLTIAFVLGVMAGRSIETARRRVLVAITTSGTYLLAWLMSYHALFSIRESVTIEGAWRGAAPWVALAGPTAVIMGILAAVAHEDGVVGDICLAVPVAWSLPEIITNWESGLLNAAAVGLPAIAVAIWPIITIGRRVRLLVVAVGAVMIGGLGLAALPAILGRVHS